MNYKELIKVFKDHNLIAIPRKYYEKCIIDVYTQDHNRFRFSTYNVRKLESLKVSDLHFSDFHGLFILRDVFNEKTLNEVDKLLNLRPQYSVIGISNYWSNISDGNSCKISLELLDENGEIFYLMGLTEIRKKLKV